MIPIQEPRARLGREEEGRLLADLAAGDRAAAERLVEQSYRGIFALLKRLSGDTELAADLTQETYRKAWASLPSFDGRAQFATWLHRIAYTTFLNHVRRPRLLQPMAEGEEETFRDPAPGVEEMVERGLLSGQLRRAVLALPDDLRSTVTALYWGELPVSEVARLEGITSVAIRKRMKRALRILAGMLEEEIP